MRGAHIRKFAFAIVAVAAAAALAACGTSPRPFSIEEAVWFHNASDYDRPPGYPLPYGPHGPHRYYAPYGYYASPPPAPLRDAEPLEPPPPYRG